MAEAFKDRFNTAIVQNLAKHLAVNCKGFDQNGFITQAIDGLEDLELKARSNQIAAALRDFMPEDFSKAGRVVIKALAPPSVDETIQFEDAKEGIAGWILMPVTDYVTEAALRNDGEYFEFGLEVLHACTQRFSAEFSIRPFLRDYTTQTLAVLEKWAVDENVHVRRLVSEGSRPYLPWGLRLHVFVDEPSLILPLLEKLKDDESEYVRRSVANNLNDIAKDHPDLVADIANKWWQNNNKNRQRLIKHACRTLIKNGHPKVLALFSYPPAKLAKVELNILSEKVTIGEHLEIELHLDNQLANEQNLLIDYVIYHQKANGSLSPKVFKWTNVKIKAKTALSIVKRHSFKLVTTRKYYAGKHQVEVLINGKNFALEDFELEVPL